MATVKKPNTRSTKQDYIEYTDTLEEQLKIYEDKLSQLTQKTSRTATMKQEELNIKESKIKSISISNIYQIKELAINFINEISDHMETLRLLEEKITFEKNRLETIYKIKTESESLFALIESKSEIIDNLNKKIHDLEKVYQIESENKKIQLQAELKKMELQAEYKLEENQIKFNNYIAKRNQEIELSRKEVEGKQQELDNLKWQVSDMQSILDNYNNKKEAEIKAAVAQANETMKKDYEHDREIQKILNAKETAVLQNEIQSYSDYVTNLEEQIESLQKMIKEANNTISEMATKTVENFQLEKSFTDMKQIALNSSANNQIKK